jgi:hypothetical protein
VADALSRPAAAVAPAPRGVNYQQLAGEQATCSDVATLKASSALHVRAVQLNKAVLWCD